MSAAVERVVDALTERGCRPRRRGGAWSATCPSHDDRVASLAVAEGNDGRALLRCHAGCATSDVLGQLGLRLGDLFDAPNGTRGDDAVATYQYTDADKRPLYEVIRRPGKRFSQRRPDPTAPSGWTWRLDGVRRVPYRLPSLLKGVAAGRWVLVVEGEKDCDR